MKLVLRLHVAAVLYRVISEQQQDAMSGIWDKRDVKSLLDVRILHSISRLLSILFAIHTIY